MGEPRRGRPRVPEKEQLRNSIYVYLDDDDYLLLRRLARKKGLTPTALARSYIKEGLTVELAYQAAKVDAATAQR